MRLVQSQQRIDKETRGLGNKRRRYLDWPEYWEESWRLAVRNHQLTLAWKTHSIIISSNNINNNNNSKTFGKLFLIAKIIHKKTSVQLSFLQLSFGLFVLSYTSTLVFYHCIQRTFLLQYQSRICYKLAIYNLVISCETRKKIFTPKNNPSKIVLRSFSLVGLFVNFTNLVKSSFINRPHLDPHWVPYVLASTI